MSSDLGMAFTALTFGLAAKMYYDTNLAGVEYIKSNVDNKKYLVRKLPDNQKAADSCHSPNSPFIFCTISPIVA